MILEQLFRYYQPVKFDPIPLVWRGWRPDRPLIPGDTFWEGYDLSNHYARFDSLVRPPISIAIPVIRNKQYVMDTKGQQVCETFCIDSAPRADLDDHWKIEIDLNSLVEGETPNITVWPSIHLLDQWHGWLTNGVLDGGQS